VLQAAGVGPIVMYGQRGDESRLELAMRSVPTRLSAIAMRSPRTRARDARSWLRTLNRIGGTSSAIQSALDIVAGTGTLVSLGIIRETGIDVLQVMRKNLTWIGVVSSVRRHFAEAIELIQTGRSGRRS
jgi:threonine dehydrogenase-like Zn-dependent dehydrogenase